MPSIVTFKALLRMYYRAITRNDANATHSNVLELEINNFANMINSMPLTINQINMLIYEHIVLKFSYDRHSVWHMLNIGFDSYPEGCIKLFGLEPLLFTPALKLFDNVLSVDGLDCESYCHYLADIEGEETAAEVYILLTMFGKNKNVSYMETFIRQKKRSDLANFLLEEAARRGLYTPPIRFA